MRWYEITPDDLSGGSIAATVMTIGEVAELAGVTTRAVRHYQQVGVLPEPPRLQNGYRCYQLRDLVLLLRLRHLSEQGLTLDEAGDVLGDDEGKDLAGILSELDEDLAAGQQCLQRQRDRIGQLRLDVGPVRRTRDNVDTPNGLVIPERTIQTCAVTVIPGPEATISVVKQQHGLCAGWWVLPGGAVKFGERLKDAALREAREKTGSDLLDVSEFAVYELQCRTAAGSHHILMYAFMASHPAVTPVGFRGRGVTGVRQGPWADLNLHPIDRRILNDAGVAGYDPATIDTDLRGTGILMVCHRISRLAC